MSQGKVQGKDKERLTWNVGGQKMCSINWTALPHTAQRFSPTALMQSVLLRGAAQRIKHLSRFLAERSLIFETTLHRIIVTPEWCFQRE